jgi:di- and tripeptidase
VSGAKTVLHSGVDGGILPEPMQDLISVLSKLSSPKSRHICIPGFYDNVRPVSRKEELLYEDIDFDSKAYLEAAGISNLDENDTHSVEILKKRWRQPSLTVHNIETSVGNSSLIPNKTIAHISIRVVPDQKLDKISSELKKFIEAEFNKLNTINRIKFRVKSSDNWWLGDPSDSHFQILASAISSVWGCKPMYVREGGTIRVTTYLEKILKAPALHFPMGQSTDRAHLDNERIRLENLMKGKDVLKHFILKFGEVNKREKK